MSDGKLECWFQAAQNNDVDFIKQHINEYSRQQDAVFGQKSALMYAAQKNHLQIIKLLLKHENGLKNENGSAAIHLAVAARQLEAVRLLIPFEEDLLNGKQKTALDLAVEKKFDEIVSVFNEASLYKGISVQQVCDEPEDSGRFQPISQQVQQLREQQDQIQLLVKKAQQEHAVLQEKMKCLGQESRKDLEIREEDVIAERVEASPKLEYLAAELNDLKKEVAELTDIATNIIQKLRARPAK